VSSRPKGHSAGPLRRTRRDRRSRAALSGQAIRPATRRPQYGNRRPRQLPGEAGGAHIGEAYRVGAHISARPIESERSGASASGIGRPTVPARPTRLGKRTQTIRTSRRAPHLDRCPTVGCRAEGGSEGAAAPPPWRLTSPDLLDILRVSFLNGGRKVGDRRCGPARDINEQVRMPHMKSGRTVAGNDHGRVGHRAQSGAGRRPGIEHRSRR